MAEKPWWETDPTILEIRRRSDEELQRLADAARPIDDSPDPVLHEIWSGACVRGLRMAREKLAAAREDYEEAVLKARRAGLSWGEIGAVLGVSRQQLHRRFRDRD
ncbi:hypothetical protein [Mycolicibacterium confluentis]|uniref:Uncharacterized protein n=1 Tax=Mycolicibacterium confluentis TaxID=28047 RepID=A0A7I7XRI8_9MYCO|nr:hypothetical protein [Mycolicibacterium confluentis]BBZ31820.1 hypothetical protein MCNF_04250 [Mycolicibacterium confluentis]